MASPFANLAEQRRLIRGGEHFSYTPQRPAERAGGDLDLPNTLRDVLPAAASVEREIMLLGAGGEGTMRNAVNLVLNLRSMGLHHMLILAPASNVCDRLWEALPDTACVWWPAQFNAPRPHSLYNTRFNRVALAFFEARKLLLTRLVVTHKLNVLHLDADTAWLANPYPLFKGPYAQHALIFQQDGPFANAGVFYVQNAAGDAAAWVVEELSRRIQRFTYHPESVAQLPHSSWARPPFFANADDQANLNDVLASALTGDDFYGAGVEMAEVRFKLRFAPAQCLRGRDADSTAGCAGVAAAKRLERDRRWQHSVSEAVLNRARRQLTSERGSANDEKLFHLCRPRSGASGTHGQLRVPHNASAARSSVLLAPHSLFAHFPYGHYFGEHRFCHSADQWPWARLSTLERRLCAPQHRVPAIAVHMAGLRQESWGRRVLMRALGVWDDAADAVVSEAWISARARDAAAMTAMAATAAASASATASASAIAPTAVGAVAAARRAAWRAPGRLLLMGGQPLRFSSIGAFDRFAGRLILVSLVLGRRPVMPPIECDLPWMRKALEPRHLRGMEVGCGAAQRCVWMPYPHHVDGWCSQIDMLNFVDFEDLVAQSAVARSRARKVPVEALSMLPLANASADTVVGAAEPYELVSSEQLLELTAGDSSSSIPFLADQLLSFLPLAGFKNTAWKAPFTKRIEAALRSPLGMGLNDKHMDVVKACMRSQLLSSK